MSEFKVGDLVIIISEGSLREVVSVEVGEDFDRIHLGGKHYANYFTKNKSIKNNLRHATTKEKLAYYTKKKQEFEEKLEALKAPKLPRAKQGDIFYHIERIDLGGIAKNTDYYCKFTNDMIKTGNYYLCPEKCAKKFRHERFEAEVKAYLKALNGGDDFWPDVKYYCYSIQPINFNVTVIISDYSNVFQSKTLVDLKKAIDKFGAENFYKFFYGLL